ncbi:MAG: hypothetical protein U0822_03095 [Anaerolineae bacterium]
MAAQQATVSGARWWPKAQSWERLLAHYVKYFAIYLVFAQTFFLSSWSKWTSGGVPDYMAKQFASTILARFPGIGPAYYFLALMEGITFILVVISFFRGEWSWGNANKKWLKLAIAWGAATFACLGFGQNLSNQYTGAYELFAYFGAALVAWLVVRSDEARVRTGGED